MFIIKSRGSIEISFKKCNSKVHDSMHCSFSCILFTCNLMHAASLFVFNPMCLMTRHLVTVDDALW